MYEPFLTPRHENPVVELSSDRISTGHDSARSADQDAGMKGAACDYCPSRRICSSHHDPSPAVEPLRQQKHDIAMVIACIEALVVRRESD